MNTINAEMFLFSAALFILSVNADVIVNEIALNYNGSIRTSDDYYDPDGIARDFIDGHFETTSDDYSTSTGIGNLQFTFHAQSDAIETYSIKSFFDLDIDDFDYDYESVILFNLDAVDEGLTWEVDEPAYEFGDIIFNDAENWMHDYGNFEHGSFDNSVFNILPDENVSVFESKIQSDVSVGFGWNFTLGADQSAVISYSISETAPANGFFIEHFNTENETTPHLFYSTSISYTRVSEPGTLSMLLLGILLLNATMVKRKSR